MANLPNNANPELFFDQPLQNQPITNLDDLQIDLENLDDLNEEYLKFLGIDELEVHSRSKRGADIGADSWFDMFHEIYCRSCFPDINKLGECEVGKNINIKWAFRNYGCNCLPENADKYPLSNKGANRKNYGWQMRTNGDPVDHLDQECSNFAKAMQCIQLDLQNGLLQQYPPDMNHMNPPNYQDITDPNTIWKYTCGPYLEVVWTYDRNDPVDPIKCGPADNPNYVNGIPPGDECTAYACSIEKNFVMQIFQDFNCTLAQYWEDNIDNYIIWQLKNKTGTWEEEVYDLNKDYNSLKPQWYSTIDQKGEEYSNTTARCNYGTPLGPGKPRECCGDYPTRYPFKTESHQCCNGEIIEIGEVCV